MYGTEKSHLPWSAPPRRRTTQAAAGEEYDANSTQRYSTVNYFGLDGSESSAASGGFTQVPRSGGHIRPGSSGYHTSNAGEGNSGEGQGEVSRRAKVNQIVQAFFWKAATVIIQSRMPVQSMLSQRTQERIINKWFNIELDEMETFREELKPWRLGDSFDPRPQPLIIETYLDTSDLTPTQALVILDGDEKRWNVTETLENAANRVGLNVGPKRSGTAKEQQIVLERWRVELSTPFDLPQNPELPVIYKKSIILFRALYTYLSLTPTWKFRRRLQKLKLHSSALKIGCRVQSGEDFARSNRRWDGLQIPLFPGEETVTEEFAFGKVESPAGSFSISVSFRKNCDFRVDDSEALLSSHFIKLDEHYFRPSRHQRTSSQPTNFATARGTEHGSLPSAVATVAQQPEYNPAFGSLSSFPQTAAASPLLALRAAADMTNRSSSNSSPAERPSSAMRSIQGSKSSLRSTDIPPVSRRASISFQPFKSASLSSSPAISDQVFQGSSLARIGTPGVQAHRPRVNIGAVSPSSYKSAHSTVTPSGEVTAVQTPIPISSGSPQAQPMTRIASSFGTRRPRISAGASVSRADDDNSSGQASYSSSMAAPGSGLYTTAGASSYEEDIQIRDFMSMLADGQKKSLKSFGGASGQSSARIARDPLSKFQRMKDSQSALADSMSSSLLLQPSSSPSTSSRNLSSVPGMVPSTTFSSSSSPGKPLSPHTPHTPAIPSRLSEARTVGRQHRHRSRSPQPTSVSDNQSQPIEEGNSTTEPLDIPLSPGFMGPRRANSMSQQQHREAMEGSSFTEFDPVTTYDNHRQSISLGNADRAPRLSRSRLLDLRSASNSALPGREEAEADSRQLNDGEDDGLPFGPARPPSMDTAEEEAPRHPHRVHRGNEMTSPSSSTRGRLSARGRGDTPPMSSTSSLNKNQSGGNMRPNIIGGGRTPSWPRPNQEDEDLLFAMSDMVQQSRRSLDQDKTAGSDSPSSGRRRSRGCSGVGDSGRGGAVGGWLPG
ncbi:autophagy-related protein 13-domain-containing protein [Trichophaea hybrida]|nr:autophagy-related protein 13-domain-containing protein [Trichophaea hybrida]